MGSRHALCFGAAVVALVVAGACNADPGGGGGSSAALCEQWVSKLRDCGLLTEGPASCYDTEPDSYDLCVANCLVEGSCDEAEDYICYDLEETNVDTCMDDCWDAAPKFACDDGEIVVESWVCDGVQGCADASDEAGPGCAELADPDFVCDDGESVPSFFECDGEVDCDDGSDEVDCASGGAQTICPDPP